MSSEPTPLPPDRVTDCAPFEIVGIDLAGPLFLKNEGKVWIVLFTCVVGEIVLVGDDNKKRLVWVLEKIIELIPRRDGKIRTVKLKTQHGTVLRRIQRIYPLEIYSNQSVVKEPGGEKSNSHDVSDIKNKLLPADDVIMRKYTSSGRYVKAPKRLDLLNNVCYVLETFSESQGGEDVVK
ncbi:hypothetical protein AVEN_23347-1 [Araneus ventricosus]|uniref:DUF5641 domain-containing protein n=1 Tax=Araneus ventricosus TaxID=182803 RepID=A0A4Y2FV34_ARAVE|nr:hypothetical protein AVEN_23347-1 [Araneus ventricosus]